MATCVFEINNVNGGTLVGPLFAGDPRGNNVARGESLIVRVNWTPAAPPDPPPILKGRFMISMAPGVVQAFASPFSNGPKQLCYTDKVAVKSGNSYTFTPLTIANAQPAAVLGRYELTFVAEDPITMAQWASDPEFDVDG